MSEPVSAGRMRLLAALLQPVETETAQGGRVVSYDELGTAWLGAGARQRRERTEEGQGRVVETCEVEARVDARLAVGRVLRFGGDDWRIVAVHERGGRADLSLETIR